MHIHVSLLKIRKTQKKNGEVEHIKISKRRTTLGAAAEHTTEQNARSTFRIQRR
jgi:hypothetical protein